MPTEIKEQKSLRQMFFEILAIGLPLVMTNVFQQLYSTSDAIVVGRGIGDFALAAIGASSYIIIILIFIFMGITVGASISISQAYGAQDYKKIHRLVHTGICVALISGVLLTMLGLFASPHLLRFVGVPKEIYPYAVSYLQLYFWGMAPTMLYNMGSAILRAVGNTKISMYCLIASTLTNLVLDIVFVFGMGLGIKSVAIATIASQIVSAGIILSVLFSREDACELQLDKLRIYSAEAKEILGLGLPSGAQSIVQTLSNIYVQSRIYLFGAVILSGVTAYTRIEGFFYMAIEGVAVAFSVIVGQLVGQKKTGEIPRYLKASMILCALIILPLSIAYYLAAEPLIRILVKDPVAVAEGVRMLKLIVPFYLIYGFSQTLSNLAKGLGRTKLSMVVVLVFTCGFRILWVTFGLMVSRTTTVMYVVYPLSWALTASVFYICYRRIRRKGFVKEQES